MELVDSLMNKQKRHIALQSVMWDYAISVTDMEKLLDGNTDKAGHYTREKLFGKILSGLPWFTVIQLLPVGEIKKMLTDEFIEQLWPDSVKEQYRYVKKRLQETLSDSG